MHAFSELLVFEPEQNYLEEKVVLITGPTSGIGRELALCCANHGATVVLVGRDPARLEQVYDQILEEGGAEPAMAIMNFETANQADMHVLADQIKQSFGRLDALVNNAGMLGQLMPLETFSIAKYESVMRVNAQAAFMLTQSCMELLRAAESASVIFTTSTVGHEPRAYWGAYALSKAVVEHLTQMWHFETQNISSLRFNCVNPGATRTAMRVQAYPGELPAEVTHPSQLMNAYLGLIGNAFANIRGQVIDLQPSRSR